MIFTWVAPRRSSSRAALRTAGTPSATCEKPFEWIWHAHRLTASERGVKSPWPPVWESVRPEKNRRGPFTSPRRTASAIPQSAPPASRTVVKPRRSIASSTRPASRATSVVGRPCIAARFSVVMVAWTWASISPGISVRPRASIRSAPAARIGRSLTSTMRSASTSTLLPGRSSPAAGSSRAPFSKRICARKPPPLSRARAARRRILSRRAARRPVRAAARRRGAPLRRGTGTDSGRSSSAGAAPRGRSPAPARSRASAPGRSRPAAACSGSRRC